MTENQNMLCIEGYDETTCEQIDMSGSMSTNKQFIKNKTINQLPWIEKYRPKNITDVILDTNTLNKIKKIITEKDMPNIIITGVPGIGKTTTIKCIAHGLYGKYYNDAVLELNASDERGIKTVDELITNFCKKSFGLKTSINNMNNVYAKHKMIILDEADNITEKAQHSINKKMEEYNSTTRFAFTCNKSSDILEAIQSRCIILRYIRLPTSKVIEKLESICFEEKLSYTDEALNEISIISQGDLRAAINNLQAVYNGMNEISVKNVYIVCDKPQPVILQQILTCCKEQQIKQAFDIMGELKVSGYSESDIVLGFMNVIKLDCKLSEEDKNIILRKVCQTAYNISKGVTTELQLYGLIAAIILSYHT